MCTTEIIDGGHKVCDYVPNHGFILEPASIAIFLKESELEVIYYALLSRSSVKIRIHSILRVEKHVIVYSH